MASFELYFSDLTEEAQKSFLEKAGLNSAEEGNYDVFPITEIEFDNEDDEEEFEDDNLTKDGVPVNKVTSHLGILIKTILRTTPKLLNI